MADTSLPLAGIRIADLSRIWAGPYATRLFADMGADVIKVESPHLPPGTPSYTNRWFDEFNVGKRSITLNLQTAAGVEAFKQLVAVSDIVIENFSARVMGQLGLDYDALARVRPDIIMLSMPGFGLSGPYCNYLAYGTVIEAMTGLSELTGYADGPPLRVATAYPDGSAARTAAFALLAALYRRQETGQGQFVELSQHEAMLGALPEAVMDYMINGRVRRRAGNRDATAVQGCYRCAGDDDWIALSITSDEEWRELCRVIGRADLIADPRFADGLRRHANQDGLHPIVAAWAAELEHHEAMRRLQDAGVPAGAVLTSKELVEDAHVSARGFFQPVTHPLSGTRLYPGNGITLSRTPGRIDGPSPLLGQHSRQILTRMLGLTEAECADLIADGVVLDPETMLQTSGSS